MLVIPAIVFLMPSILFSTLIAQNNYQKNFLAVAYRYGGFTDPVSPGVEHKERNHILDVSYWINNEFAIALSTNTIRSNFVPLNDSRTTVRTYSMTFRKNFLSRTRHQCYVELGGGFGQYCTCGDGLPYRSDMLRYLRYGVSIDYYVSRRVALGAHFQSNNIIDKIADKYAYNVIALSIQFAFR